MFEFLSVDLQVQPEVCSQKCNLFTVRTSFKVLVEVISPDLLEFVFLMLGLSQVEKVLHEFVLENGG